jgi:hypothetical protein
MVSVPDVLDAIHIEAATADGTHGTSNGVALRVDLHRFYDGGAGRIYAETPPRFEIAPGVARAAHIEWHMRPLNLPDEELYHPDRRAIALHRKAHGFPDF